MRGAIPHVQNATAVLHSTQTRRLKMVKINAECTWNHLNHVFWCISGDSFEPRLEDMLKSFERTDFEGDLFDMWILEARP
jgi:hypothetical protein